MASGSLPLDRMITHVVPLERLPEAFAAIDSHGEGMKTLIACNS
jgi:threonine dehydrogenase-like Zn-dependent dehydrogenase